MLTMNTDCSQGKTQRINSFPWTGPRDDPVLMVDKIHLVWTALILSEVGLHRIAFIEVFLKIMPLSSTDHTGDGHRKPAPALAMWRKSRTLSCSMPVI